jgi:hypothetical protein
MGCGEKITKKSFTVYLSIKILKNIVKGCMPFLFLLITTACFGQKIKSDDISYEYTRPPAVTVDKNIKNYYVVFEAAYEKKNAQFVKDYEHEKRLAEDKYEAELAAYPALVRAAENRYASEMAEYNKKSLGTKIVEKGLLDNSKPVKRLPNKPYLPRAPAPELQSSYDYSVLASTYINLQGYQNNPTNALKVLVILYGYDHTVPRTMDEQQNGISLGGGSASTTKTTYYHTEFSYRHPMAVKVFTPNGKEMLSITPPELNSYKIYQGQNTTRPEEINTELLIKTSEEKTLQNNLKFINNLVNDKYSFAKINRKAKLYYVKESENKYTDLTTAFNEASAALLMLQQDGNTAKAKLDKACSLWNTALNEADMNNKKARINKDVALAIYFNLLEANFAAGDVEAGQAILDKMNSLNMSTSDRRDKINYEMLFAEIKSRKKNN